MRNSFVFEQPSSCSNSSTEDLREAILTEMSYDTPRVEVLKPLMTATFNSRQSTIAEIPISDAVKLYPSLCLAAIVSNSIPFHLTIFFVAGT